MIPGVSCTKSGSKTLPMTIGKGSDLHHENRPCSSQAGPPKARQNLQGHDVMQDHVCSVMIVF